MIYLLEDDDGIRELVVYTLSHTGFEAEGFPKPSDFYSAIRTNGTPDLILLDIMLPEEDGLTVLKKLRADNNTCALPIIMLTAKSTEYDKVIGLDCGADDYITKPFGMMELISRVKALLRRTASKEPADTKTEYRSGALYVCPESHVATVNGSPVILTGKEFDLLVTLFKNRGIVLTRDALLLSIWGYEFDGENRTVDVHIRTLRKKLGVACDIIETVRGTGYKIS